MPRQQEVPSECEWVSDARICTVQGRETFLTGEIRPANRRRGRPGHRFHSRRNANARPAPFQQWDVQTRVVRLSAKTERKLSCHGGHISSPSQFARVPTPKKQHYARQTMLHSPARRHGARKVHILRSCESGVPPFGRPARTPKSPAPLATAFDALPFACNSIALQMALFPPDNTAGFPCVPLIPQLKLPCSVTTTHFKNDTQRRSSSAVSTPFYRKVSPWLTGRMPPSIGSTSRELTW